MRILLLFCLAILFLHAPAQNQAQKWNRQMQLKNCTIDVKAGQFTATTFIEMEFYNPYEQELEGLHRFDLKPGQVITAFQLELNGKYRDGTLEEKWKATNAYNRIVGKRIDPALLSMDYKDHYSLRIYPVPSKGSRKVSLTIQQMLSVDSGFIRYSLPLQVTDSVQQLQVTISCVSGEAMPFSVTGITAWKKFVRTGNQCTMSYKANRVPLKTGISFLVPFLDKLTICNQVTVGSQRNFAVRFRPMTDTVSFINPKQVTIFWDASGSAKNRNIELETRFLQQFISYHNLRRITIIPFNHKLLDTLVFDLVNGNGKWQSYLRGLVYQGATQLGCIYLKNSRQEPVLLFTDGRNTYGRNTPQLNGRLLFCINSARHADEQAMKKMVGTGGGKSINLVTTSMAAAVTACSSVENWLMNVTSRSGTAVTKQSLPMKIGPLMLLHGTMANESDTLTLQYGNGHAVSGNERIIVAAGISCSEPLIARLNMLQAFDNIQRSLDWEQVLDFGLEENVVTSNTAYIVLERAEDYIRYNIEAPKDLQEECKLLQYVKSNTRLQRQQLKQQDELDILKNVLTLYNERQKKLFPNALAIQLERKDLEAKPLAVAREALEGQTVSITNTGMPAGSSALNEVVVVGYGAARKSNLTASVSYVQSRDLLTATSVEQALQGRVAGVMVTKNDGVPGGAANIMIRGAQTLSGNNSALFVLDGIPVTGNINDLVHINDINDITVMRDLQATALYGSRAANGAILINTKKGRSYSNQYRYGKYRLKDMDDVEYMLEIQATHIKDKPAEYQRLQKEHGTNAAFYFDMAQHFFDQGLKKAAFDILMNAAETANGNRAAQLAVAYILEDWNMFDEAIHIYSQLLLEETGSMSLHRNLAWAYYQQGNYQQAVDLLYSAIKSPVQSDIGERTAIKATMLSEMNEIITAHKDLLNLSAIPFALIQPSSSALRIVLDGNYSDIGQVSIIEPGGEQVSMNKVSGKGAMLYGSYYGWYSNDHFQSVYHAPVVVNGKYKILMTYYDYKRGSDVPTFIRIKTFKHFGKPNQSIGIENVIMDNQYGEIEIGTVQVDVKEK